MSIGTISLVGGIAWKRRVLGLDPAIETSSDARTRQAVQPLHAVDERQRCTILMVRHLNKKEGRKTLSAAGIMTLAQSGLDKASVAVDPFFLLASVLSVLRQTGP